MANLEDAPLIFSRLSIKRPPDRDEFVLAIRRGSRADLIYIYFFFKFNRDIIRAIKIQINIFSETRRFFITPSLRRRNRAKR